VFMKQTFLTVISNSISVGTVTVNVVDIKTVFAQRPRRFPYRSCRTEW
jgi:hypothetical protein